jgi:phenylalanyl-tRNA synthetase alpha chain
MKEKLEKIKQSARDALNEINSTEQLEALRVRLLGKKGELTAVLRGMGQLPAEDRPEIGQRANEVRIFIEERIEEKKKSLEAEALDARLRNERIDVTMPGTLRPFGNRHPIAKTEAEMCDIFRSMGFDIAEGPEVEYDYYNFEALNTPANHPARDVQDTFYITDKILLRTQTSSVQIRTMEKHKPPIRIVAPGRVYRSDAIDATHSPMFNQLEGLVVDRGISMGDLKGTLELFVKKMFGEKRQIRFRPSFFPFTEPSVEVDVSCFKCEGKGCPMCKHSGWIEILGAGMVHPNVLREGGYVPEQVTGFAFGLGIERAAMLKYGIEDMRHLYTNDLRFLRQF